MARVVELTRRQFDVVKELACDGATNEEIAERLGLSVDTIKTYMQGVRRATGIKDRTALAVALVRRQVVVRITDGKKAGNGGKRDG